MRRKTPEELELAQIWRKSRGLDRGAIIKMIAGLILVFAVLALMSMLLKPRVQPWAEWVSRQLGLPGLALGTFMADAVHFPIPPQLYMLGSIVAERPAVGAISAICLGSVLGGFVAFHLAERISRIRYIQARLARTRPRVEAFVSHYGYLAGIIGAFSPIPFSTLCNVAGLYRMPSRMFLFLLALRVPRLILFYLVIRAGWQLA